MNFNRNFNYNPPGNNFNFQDSISNNISNIRHNRHGSHRQHSDYYEAVSDDDDMCFGEDDRGVERPHGLMSSNDQSQANQFSSIDLDFDQLPFVPKFSSEIRNTVEAAKSSDDINSTKTLLVADWGSHTLKSKPAIHSSQPTNCPYFPDQSEPIIKPLAKPNDFPTSTASPCNIQTSKIENLQTNDDEFKKEHSPIVQPDHSPQTQINPLSSPVDSFQNDNKSESYLPPPVASTSTSPSSVLLSATTATSITQSTENEAIKNSVDVTVNARASSSWADENGDPIQGAFDIIDESPSASSPCVNIVNNTKVEYVFHVKEKKNDPSSTVNSFNSTLGSVIGDVCVDGAIPQGTVISPMVNVLSSSQSDSTLLTSQNLNFVDIQDNSGFSDKIADEYDQKRLYEASKTKQELCNLPIQNEDTASTSALASSGKDSLQKKKTEVLNFRRNNFINQASPAATSGELTVTGIEQGKTTEEKVLESQALNELLKEVKQGAERARNYGALGWQKQPIPVVNKRFLRNTLVSTLRQPYKPPTRGGRHNTGLHNKRDNRGGGDYSDSSSSTGSSRSSRSSSRSYSRSSSSSRSYSSSSSSRSRSRSRGSGSRSRRRRHRRGSRKGNQPFPRDGPPPPNAFYDWTAAYGYPWFDPGAAAAMYYGMGDGGGYPQMYSNDPQFWAAYRDFYGIGDGGGGDGRGGFRGGRGFNPRGGVGGGRGRGGGRMMDFDDRWGGGGRERYSDEERSMSRSRSHSVDSRRERRKRSLSFENVSPDSSSTKGKKKRRSRSPKRHSESGKDEDKSSERFRSDSCKQSDTAVDGEKQDSCERREKSGSGKKKTDNDEDKKEGEEEDDKTDGKKKKKKHKKVKTKKQKSSKLEVGCDDGEKEKDESLKTDVVGDKEGRGGRGNEENKKEEHKTRKNISETDSKNIAAAKKEKKTKSKKTDGESKKKKLKKKPKEGVDVKGKGDGSGLEKRVSGDVDVKIDRDTKDLKTGTGSRNDKTKGCGDRSRLPVDGVGKLGNDESGGVKTVDENEKGYGQDRSRDERNRFDERDRRRNAGSKRSGDGDRVWQEKDGRSSSGHSSRYMEKEGRSNSDSGRYMEKGGERKRGGKIEEIERRIQERKANQRSQADGRMRQMDEDGKPSDKRDEETRGTIAKQVQKYCSGIEESEGIMDNLSTGTGSKKDKDDSSNVSSQQQGCDVKNGNLTSLTQAKGKKKKKIVKKKGKAKLQPQSVDGDIASKLDSGSQSKVTESDPLPAQGDGKKKKKKKVLKRKHDNSGEGNEDKKRKAKKKKVAKDVSSVEAGERESSQVLV